MKAEIIVVKFTAGAVCKKINKKDFGARFPELNFMQSVLFFKHRLFSSESLLVFDFQTDSLLMLLTFELKHAQLLIVTITTHQSCR